MTARNSGDIASFDKNLTLRGDCERRGFDANVGRGRKSDRVIAAAVCPRGAGSGQPDHRTRRDSFSCRASTGASVAMTMMIEPSALVVGSSLFRAFCSIHPHPLNNICRVRRRRARRRSSKRRRNSSGRERRPCSRRDAAGNRLDDVPMPPLKPKATVPVPAPTDPSSTFRALALLIAAKTSSRVMCRPRMSLRKPSLVSATSGLIDCTSSLPRESEHIIDQKIADVRNAQRRGQQNRRFDLAEFVDLRRAHQFPETVADKNRARNFFLKQISACGKIAVTPVRTFSPRIMVVCPTRTPATSVIELNSPVGKMPIFRPISRARGLLFSGIFVCVKAFALKIKIIAKTIIFLILFYGSKFGKENF